MSKRIIVSAVGIVMVLLGGVVLAQGIEFVDRGAEWGIDFVHFTGMSGELYFSEMMGSGAGLLDYDGDGDLDAYLVQGHMLGDKGIEAATFPPRHPLPLVDRLYRNDLVVNEDGSTTPRFVDVTEDWGIQSTGYGMGVVVGDIDNDGDPDIYVTNAGPNQMFRNNGDGTFTDVTAETGTGDRAWGVSAAFVDYDGDGWLDLYVGNYVGYRLAIDKKCVARSGAADYCGPLAYQPDPDRLFRNRGDGTFEDVSVRSGVHAEHPGGALGVAAGDFNGDEWLDIYVANDQVPNKLWMNQRDGTMINEAMLSGSSVNEEGQPEASMGLVVGDFNGDGVEDIFMSHLSRETNTLYLNDGTGLFTDSTRDSGLGMASWEYTGFGVSLADFDRDGWLDLFIANGAVRILEEQSRRGDIYPIHQPNILFRNLGGGRFEEISQQAGELFELSEVGRGVATGDVDEDGDADILLSNSAGPARLMVNETRNEAHWLSVRLVGLTADRATLGTRVTIHPGDRLPIWRRSSTDGSYASSNDSRVLVGLADFVGEVTVGVAWRPGIMMEWRDLPSNRQVNLYAMSGAVRQ